MKRYLFVLLIFLTFFSCKKRVETKAEYLEEKSEYEHIGASQREIISNNDKKPNVAKNDEIGGIKDFVNSRKIIKSGSITYQVKEIENIEDKVKDKVKQYGGYVSSSNFSENRLSINVKIPVEKFEDFLKEANNFGKILNKSISAEDVTKQYFDLEGRIKNKRIHQKRIRDYIEYARNIDDLIKYENELNRVTNELEELEVNYKNLSHQITFSSLYLEFSVPYSIKVSRKWPSIKHELGDLYYFIVIFLFYFLKIIIYFIIISIPIILLLGVIYFVTFGKLGLLKKMFKILSEDKKK